jgi:glycosyltransferase involved in cell wall biosynthesis
MAYESKHVAFRILVIGPLPPPVQGAALMTQRLVEEFQAVAQIRAVNVSAGDSSSVFIHHARRLVRGTVALMHIVFFCGRIRVFYLSLSGGAGQIYDLVFVIAARLLRYKFYIHHHSFAYVDRPKMISTILFHLAGANTRHIYLCKTMQTKMQALYAFPKEGLIISNAIATETSPKPPKQQFPIILGHLGNLFLEKGVDTILESFRRCQSHELPARLILAGRIFDDKVRNLIDGAKVEFGEAFEYRGPLYGRDKKSFFEEIDVFLFPSRYSNEAQPLVVFEALSSGVSVISMARGCIAEDLDNIGVVASDHDDFIGKVVNAVSQYAQFPKLISEAAQISMRGIDAMRVASRKEFQHLIADMANDHV